MLIRPTPLRLARNELLRHDASDAFFLGMARGLAARPGCCVLLSGGKLDCSRHSFITWDPFLTLRGKRDRLLTEAPGGAWQHRGDPLGYLDHLFEMLPVEFDVSDTPFAGGAVGYLSYELKNLMEQLPQTARDDLGLPDIYLTFPSRILVHDRTRGTIRYLVLNPAGQAVDPTGDPFEYLCAGSASPPRVGNATSNFTRPDYLAAVTRIREYIAAGDVYQVNLSQRFSFPLQGDPFALWERLFSLNPAPFYAYLNAGDHQVLCTSMERFLLRDGRYVETRPIKGTRPRGRNPLEDEGMRLNLGRSPKDDAELSMIVDLLRNDLGRVCRHRSIRVPSHKRVEAYQNVFHLVSTVTGEVEDGLGHGSLLRATFPGGSITGCPKIRAMEIIDELEPLVRHVYTGSIGYLGCHGNLDLNIAIRTAIVHGGRCHFSAGGGIVYDSDPEAEYQETLHKAKTLFQVIQGLAQEQP